MKTSDFVAELYREFDWRWDEVGKLKNLLTFERKAEERDLRRKALLILLYSHFEGFCVFALEHYVVAINDARIACRDAVSAVLAGAWEPVFNAMEHGDEKCRIFRKSLPGDRYLHRQWRRRHFIEEVDRFMQMPVKFSEDAVDSQSNLSSNVLKRNLFLLGLDHLFVEPLADSVDQLLARRNSIAHGDQRRGLQETEYGDYENSVFKICYQLIEFLEVAHLDNAFERPRPEFSL